LLATIAVCCAFVALLPGPPAAAGQTDTERASFGDTSAEFTDYNDGSSSELWLTIERAGEVVLDRPVRPEGCGRGFCGFGGFGRWGPTLRVADLSGSAAPEVALLFYTGGAHCCFGAQVYRQASNGRYVLAAERTFGNPPGRIRDLDRDGRPEFVTGDNRFAYRFTAYAFSRWPLRVWSFERGRLVNRTRSHRRHVRADAARRWREYRRRRGGHFDVRGVFAGWAGDMCLLGRCQRMKRELRRGVRRGWLDSPPPAFIGLGDAYPAGRGYARALLRFLDRTGYR
jgi:hypothetical protein